MGALFFKNSFAKLASCHSHFQKTSLNLCRFGKENEFDFGLDWLRFKRQKSSTEITFYLYYI